jgi:murein DD-endopeptidase MepM/ murein hydrolase activator NlpD
VLALLPPVPGPIVEPFVYAGSPFRAGLHRGVDLRAAPGAPVTAPCAGPVAYAGRFGVTLRCGRYRVTLQWLVPAVRRGQDLRAGAAVGTARGNVHLGVRRARDSFGYVDPATLLRRARPAAPVMTGPRTRGGRPAPRPAPAPRAPAGVAAPLAPWPAWAGLALVLGAVRSRRRAARTHVPAGAPVRAGPRHVS